VSIRINLAGEFVIVVVLRCGIEYHAAAVVMRFDMTLYDSDRRDVDVMYDHLVPIPEAGDKGKML
jgi:hypothetical protein